MVFIHEKSHYPSFASVEGKHFPETVGGTRGPAGGQDVFHFRIRSSRVSPFPFLQTGTGKIGAPGLPRRSEARSPASAIGSAEWKAHRPGRNPPLLRRDTSLPSGHAKHA